MNIHIAPHGKDINNVTTGLNYYNAIDKVYLLTGEKYLDNSRTLREQLKNLGIEVEIREIDPFDYRDVVDTIMDIALIHKNDNIFINVTGGTNLMAGAATTTSFFIGAVAYYVLDKRYVKKPIGELVIEIPSPKQPLYYDINKSQREIMENLMNMEKKGTANSVQVLGDKMNMYPQKIHYHIKELSKKNLVKTTQEGRVTKVEITPVGNLYLRWTTTNNSKVK